MKHLTLYLVVGLYALISAQHALASLSLRLDLEQLIAQADYIVVASGVEKIARWDRYGRIVSDVTVKVDDALKGSLKRGKTIIVTTLGGTIGELTMTVPGEAKIAIGQSALLFLRKASASNELYVVGMSQGQFNIEQRSDRWLLLPAETGGTIYEPDEQNESGKPKSAIAGPTSLDEVLSQVRRLVSTSRAR